MRGQSLNSRSSQTAGAGDPEWRVMLHFQLSLARDGCLDTALIGDASRAGRYDEQSLKRVRHYLARFGTSELAS